MDKSEAGKKGYQKTKHLLEAHVRRQKQTALEKYENNPKYCPNCDKKLPYSKRYNKFCNQSCSASYNNQGVLQKAIIRYIALIVAVLKKRDKINIVMLV